MWYGTVRYGTVRYGTVRYGTVQTGMLPDGMVQCSTVWYGMAFTKQHDTQRSMAPKPPVSKGD